VRKISWEL